MLRTKQKITKCFWCFRLLQMVGVSCKLFVMFLLVLLLCAFDFCAVTFLNASLLSPLSYSRYCYMIVKLLQTFDLTCHFPNFCLKTFNNSPPAKAQDLLVVTPPNTLGGTKTGALTTLKSQKKLPKWHRNGMWKISQTILKNESTGTLKTIFFS